MELYHSVGLDRPVVFSKVEYRNIGSYGSFEKVELKTPPKIEKMIKNIGAKLGNQYSLMQSSFQIILSATEAIYRCSYVCYCLRGKKPVSYIADAQLRAGEQSIKLVQDSETISEIASNYFLQLNKAVAMNCTLILNFHFLNEALCF